MRGARIAARPWVPVGPGQIILTPGDPASSVVDARTSIRVRTADKTQFQISDKEIALVLQVTPEPKFRWQQVLSVMLDKVIDDNGQKLTLLSAPDAAGPGQIIVNNGGGVIIIRAAGVRGIANVMPVSSNALTHSTTVRLKPEAKPSKSLKELSGTIAGRLLTEAEPMIAADNVLKAAGKTFKGKKDGEMKILTASKQADGSFQITFEFELPKDVVPETQVPVLPAVVAVPAPVPGGARRLLPCRRASPAAGPSWAVPASSASPTTA